MRFNKLLYLQLLFYIQYKCNKIIIAFLVVSDRNQDDERSSKIETPRPAKCEPEMTTVQLQIPNNSFSILFPSCTRVNRCGGCCNSDLLSCQPVASQERFFQVYVSDYSTGRLLFNKKDIVTVEEHTKCKCDCKIKSEHCNVFQEYYQKDCRCRCINHEDRKKCEQDNSTKIWNYDSCMCRCRDVSSCSTGFFFDEQSCSCKAEPVLLTRFGNSTTAWRRNPLGTRYGHVHTANRKTRLPEGGQDQYNTKN